MRDQAGNQGGSDSFLSTGFCSWNKADRLDQHVGLDVNSFHNNAKRKCEDLIRQGQSIKHALHKQTDVVKNDYRIRLNASIDVSRHLLHQGLPFRGHDESEESTNKDESADASDKEQMAVVFRFVDKYGVVKERFIGVIHVQETSSLSLKSAIDSLFAKYGLSLKKLRGQGYDGASNMKGEFNGQRSLILKESSSAYYVHCFAHQLQLVVMAVAKKHVEVGKFFDMISVLLNVVGASCKRKDKIREIHRQKVEEKISNGEIKIGTGLNQELSLQRPGNTRWGSHYKTLLRLEELFSSIVIVLEYIQDEGTDTTKRQQAYGILKYFHTFDFVFYLELMLLVMGLTDSLSKALQRKDQDILNVISLVKTTKCQLQKVRDDGWDAFMAEVSSFSEKNNTGMLKMEEEFVDSRRPRKKTGITNLHHYKVDCFYTVLDMQLQEFNDRFDERRSLDHQLEIYLDNVKNDERFTDLKCLGDLARVMVETRKHLSHPLVYRLLKLSLILPVATATVERCFSAMNFVKTTLRNRISDMFLSDCLVCFIEKQVLNTVTNESVIKRFQDMSERRVHL
ncbi:unnamed protein product [Arabidopsis thaliana]|uniref:TTF-type domain-containing protein n=1 Tax=Arabidopsis thaliana TaxID=3702 RepID=A0A654ECR4_ARATH|nr:unnamed protein product [Arabidopsis thaliana]